MKVAIVTKEAADRRCCRAEATSAGLALDTKKPDVVVTYGGDGTFLHAERLYPGVPKLLVRKSDICNTCHTNSLAHAFDAVKHGRYSRQKLLALAATVQRGRKRERLRGVNDIILRNKELTSAIRFSVARNGRVLHERLIGDGLVVATPFGSTAYYQSITGENFASGFGVAFNNTTDELRPLKLRKGDELLITLLRGPAELAADNERLRTTLVEGDRISIGLHTLGTILLHPR